MSEKEVWRIIPDSPGYEVSNHGSVRSVHRTVEVLFPGRRPFKRFVPGRMLIGCPDTRGYNRVQVIRPGSRFVRPSLIHCLVADAFLRKREPGEVVDHINGDKKDNRLSNLRVITHAQNTWSSIIKPNVSRKQCPGKYVAQINSNGKTRNLGTFDREDDAIRAWLMEKIRIHGEFANRAIAKYWHLFAPPQPAQTTEKM